MSEEAYRAVVCSELGPPDRLRLERLRRQPLAAGAVRVAIRAAGINFPDLLTIEGRYQHRPQLPFVPGVEAAGTVVETGPDVAGITVGEPVIIRLRTGGYAEEAVVAADQAVALPPAFSFAEGATFLVGHMTAYHALHTRAGVGAGQTVLVLGAAGGVGLAAVQVAKVLGARVLAAASTADKLGVAQGMGADAGINYAEEPIEEAVRRLTGGNGADVVLDPVGIAQEAALRCVAHAGKLLVAGFAGGTIPAYAANRILLRGATVMGIRSGEAGRRDPAMRRRELAALSDLAARGALRPLVSATFALDQFAEAMGMLASRRAVGRVALTMDAPA
ncbi:MAG TPA: NADPH:quinone oxidoreductase family protein [Hyphomicrobiaceae bacterium]|nr:NADPH:quinone oxidoreductase family protein [Hyphomicrobiaceae bacterium]